MSDEQFITYKEMSTHCDLTHKTMKDEIMDILARQAKFTRWMIGILVPILATMLAFLVKNDTALNNELNEHQADSRMHRTELEMKAWEQVRINKDKTDTEWKDNITKTLERLENKIDNKR